MLEYTVKRNNNIWYKGSNRNIVTDMVSAIKGLYVEIHDKRNEIGKPGFYCIHGINLINRRD